MPNGSGSATGSSSSGGSGSAISGIAAGAFSSDDLVEQIKNEINDDTLDDDVIVWWNNYTAIYGSDSAGLTYSYLYTRWKMLTLLRAKYRKAVDIQNATDKVYLNQLIKNLNTEIAAAWQDIVNNDPKYEDPAKTTMKSHTLKRNMGPTESSTSWRPCVGVKR